MINNYIDYICCPNCKEDLIESNNFLFCKKCNFNFEIRNNIPILIDKSSLSEHLLHQIEYFDNEIKSRDNYKLEEWQASYLERFNSNFGNINNSLILDCGTGSGYMCIELAKKGANVIACDLTYNNLYKLKLVAKDLNLLDRIIFVCCSAEDLPFKKSIFDYIILNAVLEHLYRESIAIYEVSRICKNFGGLMIAVPLLYKYINPIFLPINIIHDRKIGHLRRYDEIILKDKFKDFEPVKIYYTGHFGKVFKILVNKFFKLYNNIEIELEDKKKDFKKMFASNIIMFFRKK